MAKATLGGGASHTEHEYSDLEPPTQVRIHREQVGRVDQPRHGISSSASTEKPLTTNESDSPLPQLPVPTTESLSNPDQEESSSVDSTDGSGQTTEVTPSAKPAAKRAPKKASTRTVTSGQSNQSSQAEFDEFA